MKEYRIYDAERKQWLKHAYIDQKGFLHVGFKKYCFNLDGRFEVQYSLEVPDTQGNIVYQGDICQTENGALVLIDYTPDCFSTLCFDTINSTCYSLSPELCAEKLTVVGNICEHASLLVPDKIDRTEMKEETE